MQSESSPLNLAMKKASPVFHNADARGGGEEGADAIPSQRISKVSVVELTEKSEQGNAIDEYSGLVLRFSS